MVVWPPGCMELQRIAKLTPRPRMSKGLDAPTASVDDANQGWDECRPTHVPATPRCELNLASEHRCQQKRHSMTSLAFKSMCLRCHFSRSQERLAPVGFLFPWPGRRRKGTSFLSGRDLLELLPKRQRLSIWQLKAETPSSQAPCKQADGSHPSRLQLTRSA